MKQMMVLIKREFWENRSIFLVLPAVITTFFLLLVLLGIVASFDEPSIDVDIDVQVEGDVEFLDGMLTAGHLYQYAAIQLDAWSMEERERYLNATMQALSAPYLFCLWFVVFFYLLGSLYSDRKDRSILFWKSLPISDSMTVASKLLTALVVVPLVYLIGIVVLQLSVLLFIAFSTLGTEISAFDVVWRPASLFTSLFRNVGLLLFYALWALPFFSWLVAVSAFAKGYPLVLAAGAPIVIALGERIITGESYLGAWMQTHTFPISFLDQHRPIAENALANVFSLQMLSALIVGGAFIYLAIWLRGKADEI